MARKLIIPAILVLAGIFPACNEKLFTADVDCEYNCFLEKTDSVDLTIKWTQNADYPEIPVLLFKGTLDEGTLIDTFYLFADPAYIYVKADEQYTVQAIYGKPDREIWVVDGTELKWKRVSSECGDPCWTADNSSVNVRLRY